MESNHKNLKSNVPFSELPEWFKNSFTENAEIHYEYGYVIWKDGIWEGGIWKYGTWKCGIWKYGIWEGGIWKYGTWKCGTWKDGTWEAGIWEDGIWKGGIWKGGIWEDGIWKDGIWKDGIWEDGIWKDGIWKGGTWEDGTWEDGYELIGKCRWRVYFNKIDKLIKIGCKEKTVIGWEAFFNSDEQYSTKRGTPEFELIYKTYLLAKYAIEVYS